MAIKIAGTEVINDDKELVLAKLTEVNASIADTAVDVFVYDTRKDSDGGAWRKRTQHTSWYNETLNTATRGSRKDFPAVAVIVAESNQVTIYDGDDPDLPMWMVFNHNPSFYGSYGSTPSVYALNATIIIAQNGSAGSISINNYIADSCYVRITNTTKYWPQDMAGRNAGTVSGVISGYFDQGLVSRVCNDIAMTVLPNAPIDPATGLPVPTILVGTGGNGTYSSSVITDSGSVYDIASDSTGTAVSVAFDGVSATVVRSDGTVYVWNDVSTITSDGVSPDTTYTTVDTLGTVSMVA